MVLLSNDNPIDIKRYHILQCLNKKRDNFKIEIVPLEETLKKQNITFDQKEIKQLLKNIQKIEK